MQSTYRNTACLKLGLKGKMKGVGVLLGLCASLSLSACGGGGGSAGGNATVATGIITSQVGLVEVSSASKASIDVSWLPASDGVTPANQVIYKVYASTAATLIPSKATLKFQGRGISSTHITGLTAATRYTVMVTASTPTGYKSVSSSLQVKTSSLTPQVNPTAAVIHPTISQTINISPYQMTLASTAPKPKVGGFIVNAKNKGILRKVVKITTNPAGQTVVQTQAASLNEVVNAVNFSSSVKLQAVPLGTPSPAVGVLASSNGVGTNSKWAWANTGFSLSSIPSKPNVGSIGLAAGAVGGTSQKNINMALLNSKWVNLRILTLIHEGVSDDAEII